MKKFILLSLLLLSSVFCNGQTFTDYWLLPTNIKVCDYDGTTASYKFISETLHADTMQMGYPFIDGYGYLTSGMKYFNDPTRPNNGIVPYDSLFYSNTYSTNGNVVFPFVYDKSQSDARYKPLSYIPSWSEITGKPSLFSGAYADLTGKPSLFSGSYLDLTNKPSLFSGSYTDLTNKPTIPTNTNQLTNGSGFLTSEVDGSVTNEIELPSQTGNSGRTLLTNGTSVSWGKKQETFSGTTNGSGNYTVTFANAYSVAPNIQANIVGGTALQRSIITSITTTGFTVIVVSQNTNTLLGIINLVSSTSIVTGANIDVLITEK